MALRVASLDYLGTVAARLRKDAVTSKMDQRSIDRILQQVEYPLHYFFLIHIDVYKKVKYRKCNFCSLLNVHSNVQFVTGVSIFLSFWFFFLCLCVFSLQAMMRPSSSRRLYWIIWKIVLIQMRHWWWVFLQVSSCCPIDLGLLIKVGFKATQATHSAFLYPNVSITVWPTTSFARNNSC